MKLLYLICVGLYGKVSSFNSSHVRSQQIVISFDSQSLVAQPLCPLLTTSLDRASAAGRWARRDSDMEVVTSDVPETWACQFWAEMGTVVFPWHDCSSFQYNAPLLVKIGCAGYDFESSRHKFKKKRGGRKSGSTWSCLPRLPNSLW